MDFGKEKLTERNKENSFLDVDWVITELLNFGREKLALNNNVPSSPQTQSSSSQAQSCHSVQRSTSMKSVTKIKKKVREQKT